MVRSTGFRILMALVLLALSVTPAWGHGSTGSVAPRPSGSAPATELPNGGDAYSGPTWVRHGQSCSKGQICPQHNSVEYHYHYVTGVTGNYDGYYDYSTGFGCTGPCTVSYTLTMTWTNKWGASIGFDKGPISGRVGYDVSYSSSRSFSFSFPVPKGQTKVVRYRDWYHVTNLSLRTDYLASYPPYPVVRREYGSGWGGQWYQRIFYAKSV